MTVSKSLFLFLALAGLWEGNNTPTKADSLAAPQRTTYNGLDAFRLSEGTTEAMVVPSLSGRVMRFGPVGGQNWLWNAPPEKLGGEGYQNGGGDKTFVGPHGVWATFANSIWPPDPSWDGPAFEAQTTPEGHLNTLGPVWRGFGVRIAREFWFENGEFVIRQTMQNRGRAAPAFDLECGAGRDARRRFRAAQPQNSLKNRLSPLRQAQSANENRGRVSFAASNHACLGRGL